MENDLRVLLRNEEETTTVTRRVRLVAVPESISETVVAVPGSVHVLVSDSAPAPGLREESTLIDEEDPWEERDFR